MNNFVNYKINLFCHDLNKCHLRFVLILYHDQAFIRNVKGSLIESQKKISDLKNVASLSK